MTSTTYSVYRNGSKLSGNYDGMNGTASIFFEMSDRLQDMWDSVKNPMYNGLEIVNVLETKPENGKLQKTEDVIYIIWNLPCYVTCPNATEHCKKGCYAENSEIRYPQNTLTSRFRNLAACTGDNADSFVRNMIYSIEKLLSSKAYKGKTVRVRIHESGDFFSKQYAMQWLEIAAHFANVENIVFMAYTKSFSFFDGVALPENFVLRASVWDDTSDSDLETIKRNNWPIYTALPESLLAYATENKGFTLCTCENCSTCEKHCFTRDNKYMCVALHSSARHQKSDIDRLTSIVDMFSDSERR